MKTLYESLIGSISETTNVDLKRSIKIVIDLMSKYDLTSKDLFSFCICAVNFLEYYE